MKTRILILSLSCLAGCSVDKPPENEVAAIEALTARSACIGSLDRWHREFSFQKRGDSINRDIISISYEPAGHRGLSAGRTISEPEVQTGIDDSMRRVAGGEYNRRSRRFEEWSCGCSFSPYNVDHQTECRSTD